MTDNIDKVQTNNLMPFEEMTKDKDLLSDKKTSRPSEVDDVGISSEYWMTEFRQMWNTEYPRSAEKWGDDFWASWFKNFSSFTRQDLEWSFNEVRKIKRDMPPNLSHLYDFCTKNAQKRIRLDDVGSQEKRCQDIEVGKCIFGDPYWQLTKYGTHEFRNMCINLCDNYEVGYPDEYQLNQRPEPQTKGKWFETVAMYLSNTDEKIADSEKTQKDRKFETYQFAELFPDGNIKEVLKYHKLDENLSFVEQCQRIAEMPKTKTLLDGI